MRGNDLTDSAAIRREVATVRMLLEELDQLTGEDAGQVSQQLAEELAALARRLLHASTTISGARRPKAAIG